MTDPDTKEDREFPWPPHRSSCYSTRGLLDWHDSWIARVVPDADFEISKLEIANPQVADPQVAKHNVGDADPAGLDLQGVETLEVGLRSATRRIGGDARRIGESGPVQVPAFRSPVLRPLPFSIRIVLGCFR